MRGSKSTWFPELPDLYSICSIPYKVSLPNPPAVSGLMSSTVTLFIEVPPNFSFNSTDRARSAASGVESPSPSQSYEAEVAPDASNVSVSTEISKCFSCAS